MIETIKVYRVIMDGEVTFETDNFDDLLSYEILPNTTDYDTNDLYGLLDYYCNVYGAEIKMIIKVVE